jgi:hypothetical protein
MIKINYLQKNERIFLLLSPDIRTENSNLGLSMSQIKHEFAFTHFRMFCKTLE